MVRLRLEFWFQPELITESPQAQGGSSLNSVESDHCDWWLGVCHPEEPPTHGSNNGDWLSGNSNNEVSAGMAASFEALDLDVHPCLLPFHVCV